MDYYCGVEKEDGVMLVNVFSHLLDKRLLYFIHSLNFRLGATQAQ